MSIWSTSLERAKKLLDNGLGAPHKVLKAYMDEVGWPAEPIENAQGLHTVDRVNNSSLYALNYILRLGPTLITHMGQCHQCNLTLSSNTSAFVRWHCTPTPLFY